MKEPMYEMYKWNARILAVVVAMLVAQPLAQAQGGKRKAPPAEFRNTYYDAQVAYRLGELAKAEKLYKQAGKLYQAPGVYRGLAAVYVDYANISSKASRRNHYYEKCVEAAFAALKIAPDSSKAGETRALHGECRSKLGRPDFRGKFRRGQGVVAVITDRIGARVKINGNLAGATPIRPRPVNAGRAVIEVETKNGRKKSFVVDILEGVVSDVILDEAPVVVPKKKAKKSR